MIDATRRRLLSGLAAVPLLGCAGYRGGWESVAYVGDEPPADAKVGSALELPGVTLRVSINNKVRSRDTQVVLFVVPASFDPRDVYAQGPSPGRTRVYLSTTPLGPGWIFRPTAAVLSFGGARHTADAGYEFGQWDASGQRVGQGGRYDHQPVGAERALPDVHRRYYLSVDFATAVPDPRLRDIVVDAASCLTAPTQPPLPPIRFAPARWEEGYT